MMLFFPMHVLLCGETAAWAADGTLRRLSSQTAKLTARDDDLFGYTVAIDGNLIVVGADDHYDEVRLHFFL